MKKIQSNVRKHNKHKGISLIVLVITIIVIIILAAAVILTINNNNPMSNANRARYESDRANVQNALTTAVGKIMGEKLCKLNVPQQDNIVSGILYELTGANDGIAGGKIGWDKNATDAPSGYEQTTNLGMKMPTYTTSSKWGIDTAGNVILTVGDMIYGPNAGEEENLVANKPLLTGFNADVTYYTKWNGFTEDTSVKINGTEPTDWYDYSAGIAKWANIKTTGNGNDAYWVWIPRYAYQVPEKSSTAPAEGIQIKFLKGTSNIPIGETTEITNTTPTPGSWVVHPAFQFGDKAVSGIWVAKYEASSSNPAANNGGDNVTNLQVRVVPNITSWRGMQVSNIFTVCRNLETAGNTLGLASTGMQANGDFTTPSTNLNSHMMKSTEWGAVAYLSRSKYGKNAPVWINNSSSYITGNAGNSQDASSVSGITNAYNTTDGQQASTTGNVYGVYDMSGGAFEYVSAYNNGGGSYASSILSADHKYKNVYPNSYSGEIYGDGGYEISTVGIGGTSWDGDYSIFPTSSNPFVVRGGSYGSGSGAGVFGVSAYGGYGSSYYGFRPVVCGY